MPIVNMLEAKTNLSKLVEAVESGAEDEIIIARNGKPAAKLTPLNPKKNKIRLGLAKGKWVAPADPFALDDEIEAMFTKSAEEPW
ncbi:MAG: type II toxin-antitoxin system Phd/YefM family antitoxin [Caulobacteraceae bacterium]